MRVSYFPAKPPINYPNVVPSLSPGLPREAAATRGKLSHKIQPLISRKCGPREARIKIAAHSPKIQNSTLKIRHCFLHPQTNPHPKSTLAHPKSTVDLGCEQLIRGENGLRPPLSPTFYRPKSGPKIRESNQNQTATNQKSGPKIRESNRIQTVTNQKIFIMVAVTQSPSAMVAVRKDPFCETNPIGKIIKPLSINEKREF